MEKKKLISCLCKRDSLFLKNTLFLRCTMLHCRLHNTSLAYFCSLEWHSGVGFICVLASGIVQCIVCLHQLMFLFPSIEELVSGIFFVPKSGTFIPHSLFCRVHSKVWNHLLVYRIFFMPIAKLFH